MASSVYSGWELNDFIKKKSASRPENDINFLEGIMNRNSHLVKFPGSKDNNKTLVRQKYKRSEEVKSLMDRKKMGSFSKI